ncbi:MAG: 30S ribosomal protein S17 [Candidatus Nomurabacteria bacterium]|nr:30S ribosomal protein S17 [Candidatus Nomurabacteria bacterium]
MNENKTKQHTTLSGIVVSDKMDKTVVVNVERFVKHQKYGKYYTTNKKYKAHDASNTHKVGDVVTIVETHPISKDKHFKVVNTAK